GPSGYGKSFVITASEQSQRVAIAWSGGRGDGTEAGASVSRFNGLLSGRNDNDIYVMTSADAGETWSAQRNVTQRLNADPGGFAPHAKLSILFDDADVLHVAWQAVSWPGYGAEFTTRSRMFHWDETWATVRTITDAVWDPELCDGGENTLNLDNPQLSFCAGKLYLTYTLYAPVPSGRGDDCAARAFSGSGTGSANGDIYVSVSANGGFNWDPPRNLTNTYTPHCDTLPGPPWPDCDSDAWASATRYGIDITGDDFDGIPDLTVNVDPVYAGSDYLFVQYINDADPGAAIAGEGGWTNNSVNVFRFGCVNTVSPVVCLASSIPVGQAVGDPAHTPPGQDSTISWRLENTGNTDLNYTYEVVTLAGPEGHTTVNGESSGGGTIGSGLINFVDLPIRLNATLSTVVESAASMIILDGDPGACFFPPDTFFINYCICDIQSLKVDSLENFMILANNGNIGRENNQGDGKLNFDFVGDPAECDTSAISYLFDGSPVISYNNGQVVTAMFSQSIVDSFQFRPQGEPFVETGPAYEHASSSLFTTQDSALGLSVDYWTPPGNLPVAGTWKPVIVRVGYYNLTDAPLDSVFCAYALDWDVPSDSGVRNTSAIQSGAAPTYVYQQGAEFGVDTGNSACRDNSARYAATIYTPPSSADLPPHTDGGSGAMGVGFQALYTRDNATFVGGDWDHRALDSMLRSNFGINTFNSPAPDSQHVDLHTMLNGGAYRIDPDDTLYLWLRLLTGFGTQAEFEGAAAATIALRLPPGGCCKVPGDANGDGRFNIADITYLIAYLFAGGPAPVCCESADANGDGKTDIRDIIWLIRPLFVIGAPFPVCGPIGMTCGG
ncbi:MAG: dockerin type I repeat-containing protein, partial [Candidatus Zixiibacteriota bacterium]